MHDDGARAGVHRRVVLACRQAVSSAAAGRPQKATSITAHAQTGTCCLKGAAAADRFQLAPWSVQKCATEHQVRMLQGIPEQFANCDPAGASLVRCSMVHRREIRYVFRF